MYYLHLALSYNILKLCCLTDIYKTETLYKKPIIFVWLQQTYSDVCMTYLCLCSSILIDPFVLLSCQFCKSSVMLLNDSAISNCKERDIE